MGQEPLSAWERVSQNPFAGTFVASGLLILQNNWIEVSLPEDY